MTAIRIVQPHSLSPDLARSAAQQVVDKMSGEYGLACRWDGDVLRFERSGVSGTLTLHAKEARMAIQLGFPMSAFAGAIQAKVAEKMKKVFA